MPNQNSNAGHIPLRSCVICKKKIDQYLLLNFYLLNKEIIFDIHRKVPTRKSYVCHNELCINALDKWLVKRNRKKHPQKRVDKDAV